MPLPLLFFVGGAVASSVIGAGVAYLDYRNRYNRNERIAKKVEDEVEAVVEAFEFARDPLRRDSKVIRSQLRIARYGYINEYFPENNCVGPPISPLERLLQQGGSTGVRLGDLISEYYPGFRSAIRKTCRSLNGWSQNGSKYKLSHLMYELYHAIFGDLWELALPYIIAEASTTMKIITLPLDEMKGYEEEAKRLFDISYSDPKNWGFDDDGDKFYAGDSKAEFLLKVLEDAKKFIRDHFPGDFDYSWKISDDSIEYVKRNAFFIPFVILALYFTYLIGRYLVNQQIPDPSEIFYIIKEACVSMFGAIHPLCYLALRVVFRLFTCQPLLPRSMQAWDTFNREQELNPVAWTWSVRFEVYVTEPLRIAMERGIGHLSGCYEDVLQLMERFIEMSQDLFHQNVTVPFNDFSHRLFRGGSSSQATTEKQNPFLLSTLLSHPHSD